MHVHVRPDISEHPGRRQRQEHDPAPGRPPGWINIYDDPNYSYRTVIANQQANLELSKTEILPEQYQRMKALLAHMDRVFGDHGTA